MTISQVLGAVLLTCAGLYLLPRVWQDVQLRREIRSVRKTYTQTQRELLDRIVNPTRRTK